MEAQTGPRQSGVVSVSAQGAESEGVEVVGGVAADPAEPCRELDSGASQQVKHLGFPGLPLVFRVGRRILRSWAWLRKVVMASRLADEPGHGERVLGGPVMKAIR